MQTGEGIMNEQSIEQARRRDFGQRVRILRRNINLSREELSEQTNIPFKTIGDIERGEKVLLHLDWDVKPLADFFGLRSLQREEFFAAAGLLIDCPETDDSAAEWSELLTNFYRNRQFPAFVTDPLYTFHSANSFLNTVYGLYPYTLRERLYEGAGPNVLRFLLDPSFGLKDLFGGEAGWRRVVEDNLCLLRVNSMRYLGTPMYDALIEELQKLPAFAPIWEQVCSPDYVSRARGRPLILHPGTDQEMQFTVTYVYAARIAGVEQHLILYIPANEATAAHMQRLREMVEPVVYQYSRQFPHGYREMKL